MDSLKNYAVLE